MISSIHKSSSPVLGVGTTVEAAELNLVDDFTIGGHVTMADTKNFVLNTGTGTKVGTATGQKLGFYGATPVDQPATITDGSDAASTQAAVNAVIDRLQELGLIA
jgi:hypothetical protein